MAILAVHKNGPSIDFDGFLYQTPRSGQDHVGTYAEVFNAEGSRADVICADLSTTKTPGRYAENQGWISRNIGTATDEDRNVRRRIQNHDPIFIHLFVVHDGYEPTFEDWLEVALVDGKLPERESGWDLDGTTVHLYELSTTWRDAVALGKAQRSMEAVGGDTSVAQIVQRVHDEVEAPISLISKHIHQDEEYSLFRPGHIYQTMFSGLVDNRHEQFDRSSHFAEINLTQP